MKGVMEFLEKAGLVTQEMPSPAGVPVDDAPAASARPGLSTLTKAEIGLASPPGPSALNLAELYASAGVPVSVYPAERLLRLIDGLSAMDEATRNLAIKAMDEADESWTIADPLDDASAKLQALATHAARIREDLQLFETETQKRLADIRVRHELRVGEIRKQMSELEALLAREVTRGDEECANQEANLAVAREKAAREMGDIAQSSSALQRLGAQFGASTSHPNIPGQE